MVSLRLRWCFKETTCMSSMQTRRSIVCNEPGPCKSVPHIFSRMYNCFTSTCIINLPLRNKFQSQRSTLGVKGQITANFWASGWASIVCFQIPFIQTFTGGNFFSSKNPWQTIHTEKQSIPEWFDKISLWEDVLSEFAEICPMTMPSSAWTFLGHPV